MKHPIRLIMGMGFAPILLFASESPPPPRDHETGESKAPNAFLNRLFEEAGKPRPDQVYTASDPLSCAVSLAKLTKNRDEERNVQIVLWVDALLARDDMANVRQFLETFPAHHPVRGIILAKIAHWHAVKGPSGEWEGPFQLAKAQLPYTATADREELILELAATLEAAEESEKADETAASLDLSRRVPDIRWNSRKALERARLGKEHSLYVRSEYRENHMDPDWIPNGLTRLELAALAFDRDESSTLDEKLNKLRGEVKLALDVTPVAKSVEMSLPLRALQILRDRGESDYQALLLEQSVPYIRIKPLTFSQKGAWTADIIKELMLAGEGERVDALLEALEKQTAGLMLVQQPKMHIIRSVCLRLAEKPEEEIKASDARFESALKTLASDDYRKNLLLEFCLLLYEHDLEVGPEKLKNWFQTATH